MRAAVRRLIPPALAVLGALLWPFWAAPAAAQEELDPEGLLSVEDSGLVTTLVGTGHLLTLPAEIERVALADEAIARVQVISTREALITGLAPGQTTLYAWLAGGQRLRYLVQIGRDHGLLIRVLRDLDPRIGMRVSPDGTSVVLTGEVADQATAAGAVALAENLLRAQGGTRPTQVISLLTFPQAPSTADLWLTEALAAIDPRIRLRRIQVGPEPAPERDTYVLEGRVKNVQSLVRAVILAERQLGGAGVRVEAPAGGLTLQRNLGFLATGDASAGSLQRPPAGLAAQVARGLVITSESGRVLSLLEVDELPQIMVSIRVYEIDRAKARRAGVNFRFDSEHVSVGSSPGPLGDLPRLLGGAPSVTNVGGNLAAAFVDQTFAIVAAIDYLQDKELARSVSEPNVLTLSGEEATIQVGGEVPIPSTAVGQVTTVQGFTFQTFGVQLDIRPTVDEAGVIALEVSPSIIRPSAGLAVGGVPGFQVQSVQTTARVPAGHSLVLGGLLSFEEGLEESRVPWLGRLPLFRWRRNSRQEQELLFVITPRLVAMPETPPAPPVPPAAAGDVALPALEAAEPEDPERWDETEPGELPPDGVPPGLRRGPDPEAAPPPAPPPAGGAPFVEDVVVEIDEEEIPVEPEPASEPASPDPEIWVVREATDPCLVLRMAPSAASARLDCLPPGTGVRPIERSGVWWRVLLADGRTGWVAGSYLAPVPEER
ncbi:MAG TPA: pilus assembly protein N-terminal domain-containing protein [Thermoanaerobaculia bacterium]